MQFFLSAVGLSVGSALAMRLGLRGSLWVGGAIGLVLFYGAALPLLAGFEGERQLTDPTSFFLAMGAFAIASATLGALTALRRWRKLLLAAASVSSLPMSAQMLYFTPLPAWGLAVVGFIPASVFLAYALYLWMEERAEAGAVREFRSAFLPHLPSPAVERLIAAYYRGPSKQLVGRKFHRPGSSAQLAANAFGFFLDQPAGLPPLPGCAGAGWPAQTLAFDAEARLPWLGAGAARLDVLIETNDALIGIVARSYEPFIDEPDYSRASINSPEPLSSKAYSRPVWNGGMSGHQRLRDGLVDGSIVFSHLDADYLVQSALALHSAARRSTSHRKSALVYMFAEPATWPNGELVEPADLESHRAEAARFAEYVSGDEAAFHFCSYRELLDDWERAPSPDVRAHAALIRERFAP